ncbi:MAG: type IV pilus assembly protein PilC [Candidatus Paceibacteria bacterium]|jgi:type IV pilus assembly protein PilC
MPLYIYKAIDKENNQQDGTVEAINVNVAISTLQRRGYVIKDINEAGKSGGLNMEITLFERVKNKDIVILSRQMSTLFNAQVSALKVFRLLASETENPKLGRKLGDVAENLQNGSTISAALSKHPDVFSNFYINMVKAGEESGKLAETLDYLADYLDRTYEIVQKAKNALIYPAFVVFTFISVMVLMLTFVIPKISQILVDSGQEIPIYTKVVIGLSNFFVNYGVFLLISVVVGGFFFYRYTKTAAGHGIIDEIKMSVPYVGTLYEKLYLSRIADNLNTMLLSGISMIKALEHTAGIVDNVLYERAITASLEDVKGGLSVSVAFSKHKVFPNILIQMIKVGEETGNLGEILETLADFYRREVRNAIDTLVDLIEPLMIVLLGLGVGSLLASVLIPIYNISTAF